MPLSYILRHPWRALLTWFNVCPFCWGMTDAAMLYNDGRPLRLAPTAWACDCGAEVRPWLIPT